MFRTLSALSVLLLVGCSTSELSADTSDTTTDDNAFWWWGWDTSDDEEEEEDREEEVPHDGDPDWFDADCSSGFCAVRDGFDPIAWADQAHRLCLAETGHDMDMQRVNFSTDRVYVDDFRASEADWEYRFVIADPDDLWGYRYIDCIVDVSAGEVVVDSTFTRGAVASVDRFMAGVTYGIDHALEDQSSLSRVTRGGIRWDSFSGAPEIYLADDEWNDWDEWNASTGASK
jgi:hypothetical protein